MTLKDHITFLGVHFALANLVAVAWCAVGRPRYACGGVAVYVLMVSFMYPRMVRQMNAERDNRARELEELRTELDKDSRQFRDRFTAAPSTGYPFAGRSPDMH